MASLLIRGARVLDPSQKLDAKGDILVRDGRVETVQTAKNAGSLKAETVINAVGLTAAPGFIDMHCHLREPGEEYKETIATGTASAACGGFTTICCMPNTQPPIDDVASVRYVQERARIEGKVRVLPIACVTRGRRGKELADMAELAQAGVIGFSDDGSPVADATLMRSALSFALLTGLPIMNHCEDPALVAGGQMNEGPTATRLGLRGIPSESEETMVARDIALSRLTGGWVHICHISTKGSVELVRKAKAEGLRVTAEVTPHHLTLTDEWVAGSKGGKPGSGPVGVYSYDTNAKVAPPLRSQADVDALINALNEGTIDVIATDHAPHDALSKKTTFEASVSGITGFETAFGSLIGLVQAKKLTLTRLIESLTVAPARLLGKNGSGLGSLKAGAHADIVLLDLEKEWIVEAGQFASKGKNTPLNGITLRGMVAATVFDGKVIYQHESVRA
jgi:dihydroorotase